MNKSIIFSLLFTLSFTACAKTASDNYFGEQQSSSKKEYESFRKNIACPILYFLPEYFSLLH